MTQSTPRQRQQIGYLRKLVGIDEDTYREMMFNMFNVESSKDLTITQANSLLIKLRNIGAQQGTFKPKLQYSWQKNKYNSFEGRDAYMASPAQLRLMEILWYKISRQTNDKDRASALDVMIKKIVNKDSITFLTKSDVAKMIKTFKTMEVQYA